MHHPPERTALHATDRSTGAPCCQDGASYRGLAYGHRMKLRANPDSNPGSALFWGGSACTEHPQKRGALPVKRLATEPVLVSLRPSTRVKPYRSISRNCRAFCKRSFRFLSSGMPWNFMYDFLNFSPNGPPNTAFTICCGLGIALSLIRRARRCIDREQSLTSSGVS